MSPFAEDFANTSFPQPAHEVDLASFLEPAAPTASTTNPFGTKPTPQLAAELDIRTTNPFAIPANQGDNNKTDDKSCFSLSKNALTLNRGVMVLTVNRIEVRDIFVPQISIG